MRVFTPEETAKWFAGLEKRMSSGTIIVRDTDDRILIVKTTYHDYWSLPGGIIDAGETPRKAAVRELQEEAGIMVPEDIAVFRYVIDHVGPNAHSYQFVFEAKVPSIGNVVLDEEEIEAYDIVTRQQILDHDRNYSDSVKLWAENFSGYAERDFFTLDRLDD